MQIIAHQHLAVRKGERKELQEVNVQQKQVFPEMQNSSVFQMQYEFPRSAKHTIQHCIPLNACKEEPGKQ
jgi:hypothetical protein